MEQLITLNTLKQGPPRKPSLTSATKTELNVLGVQSKPASCRLLCQYFSVGSGWVPDFIGSRPKVAFMLPHPTGDDSINRSLMTGRGGDSFFKKYITPLGYDREDCIFSAVIRCRPRGNGAKSAKWGTPLTGNTKKMTEESCRHHDVPVLGKWNPDLILLTFSLGVVYTEPAFTRLLQRDIAKAFEFAQKGYRPLVLMGNEAGEMFMPFIKGNGGSKGWRGNWQEQDGYPFLPDASKPKLPVGFQPIGWSR